MSRPPWSLSGWSINALMWLLIHPKISTTPTPPEYSTEISIVHTSQNIHTLLKNTPIHRQCWQSWCTGQGWTIFCGPNIVGVVLIVARKCIVHACRWYMCDICIRSASPAALAWLLNTKLVTAVLVSCRSTAMACSSSSLFTVPGHLLETWVVFIQTEVYGQRWRIEWNLTSGVWDGAKVWPVTDIWGMTT